MNPSPSPLRLVVHPAPGGVSVRIIKRRGPTQERPLLLTFEDAIDARYERVLESPAGHALPTVTA
jgi:protein ImuA